MKVAIVGSRNCYSLSEDDIIPHIPFNCSEIISGGAKGVDALAKSVAERLNIDFREILPDYKKYGRRAPIVRNMEIADSSYLVLAFWDMKSRGTAFVLSYCIENHIPFKIIDITSKKC